MRRPGVAMTISTPFCKSRICGPFGAPPYIAVLRIRELDLICVLIRLYDSNEKNCITQIWCTPAGFVLQVLEWEQEQGQSDHHQRPKEVV